MFARCLRLACAAALAASLCAAEPAPAPETQPARGLYDGLLEAMKNGPALGYAGRIKLLDPEIRRDFNLPLMTRLVVGPTWRTLKPADQEGLVAAFSDYSIAVYAARFKSYGGEQFKVDPAPSPLGPGEAIVHTQLIPSGADAVRLDYRVRLDGSAWRIIDVYLSGSISELAARRSEYSAILRDSGAQGLIDLLKKKTADLAG